MNATDDQPSQEPEPSSVKRLVRPITPLESVPAKVQIQWLPRYDAGYETQGDNPFRSGAIEPRYNEDDLEILLRKAREDNPVRSPYEAAVQVFRCLAEAQRMFRFGVAYRSNDPRSPTATKGQNERET